jgi:beta-galactosidase
MVILHFILILLNILNGGGDNVLAVRLENQEESSRWYPGAGIYRNVRLVITNPTHVSTWGTFITTPQVSAKKALVNVQTQISQSYRIAKDLKIATTLFTSSNQKIITKTAINFINDSTINQEFEVLNPKLWSANQPQLYYAITSIIKDGNIIDNYKTIFGIRKIEFKPNEGMLVNDTITKIKGVCLHHDLGALGTAINKSALRYRLQLLKDMGCNAIRGTHNPHAPEMLALCDEMGFYFIDEAFDEWKYPKVKNGYHLLFDEWAKKDIEAMVFRDRNHPALIMYSIGNEIKEQNKPDGSQIAKFLRDICHQADSTRPVTAGFDNWNAAIKNGLADAVDIPGWNYKPQLYKELHQKYPNWVIYGSETASTVSSRGAYPLPAVQASMKIWPDNQSSSFDLERCSWSQIPDTEWKSQDSNDFVAGEFVWTGVDYLGEPTPYSANWPSRSSYFGIIDLSGLPKDRYYLYQSHWSDKKMLHILPHWNWVGKEGQNIPVYAYTNYPSAELFINGKSFGKKTFDKGNLLDTYRLRWDNAIYQPGEIKVVAYDQNGAIAETKSIKTAGKPANIVLQSHSNVLQPNGKNLAFVTVTVVDKDGNLCPLADNLINFKVIGAGFLRAVDNGNPASLEPFQVNYRKAFFGKCMAMVQNNNQKGKITIEASAKNLKTQYLTIQAK